jgi:hypothetical protein
LGKVPLVNSAKVYTVLVYSCLLSIKRAEEGGGKREGRREEGREEGRGRKEEGGGKRAGRREEGGRKREEGRGEREDGKRRERE